MYVLSSQSAYTNDAQNNLVIMLC